MTKIIEIQGTPKNYTPDGLLIKLYPEDVKEGETSIHFTDIHIGQKEYELPEGIEKVKAVYIKVNDTGYIIK